MTIDEMRNRLDKYCKGFDLCSDGCPLRKPDDGRCRWKEFSDESTEDCYHFLIAEGLMQQNIDKLRARYPNGFSADRSLHRAENDV